MKKTVWILNHYAQVPGGPGGTRHYHFAEYLPEHGWQAFVIAASTELKTGSQRLPSWVNSRLDMFDGVPFFWVRTPTYSGNGLGRILNMLTYCWQVLRKKNTQQLPRPDVVIGSSVHPFAAAAGALLAKRFNVPFIFEVRDLWPQTLIDMGRLKEKAWLTRILQKLELWLYRKACRIVVLLPMAHEYMVPLGIPRDKIFWIPNGTDLALFPQGDDVPHTNTEEFTLMYFGAHGQANGLDNILKAMKIVEQSNSPVKIKLRLIGDGPCKLMLVALAQNLELKRVFFEPPVAKDQIASLASQADAFVIDVLDLPNLYRFGISMNKLYDYLASARPVIISCGAANNHVDEAGAGVTVSAGKPEELANAILSVAAMPLEQRLKFGKAGRDYVEKNHDFKILSQKLAVVLDECVKEDVKV